MMYSCKSRTSETFVPALKEALKIPWNAIRLDIDKRQALAYQARATSLLRKNSKQRLPNGAQLQLVPCFTSATGKSMMDTKRSDVKTLLER
jgi:hypothetical protein